MLELPMISSTESVEEYMAFFEFQPGGGDLVPFNGP